MSARSIGTPPRPESTSSIDELTARLRILRAWAGVSYRELHRRVVRAGRIQGIVETPSYATVYRCFQPGRRRLDIELVVDIVRALTGDESEAGQWRQAHQRIVGEADLSAVVTVADALPRDMPDFVGRDAELKELLAAEARSSDPTVISSIEGMAGIGKTTLAHAAHLLASDEAVEVVLFVNLRGYDAELPPADPAAVLNGFLRRLGVPGTRTRRLGLSARSELFRDLVKARRAVVLLDNAASEKQVRPLLPDSPTCRVLITSRRRLRRLPKVRQMFLDVLSQEESLHLLGMRVGQARVAAEMDAARDLVELAGHLPLALAVIAARMDKSSGWTIADHRDRLADRRSALRIEGGVALAVASSYESLPVSHRRILGLLALHPGRDLDAYAAAALTAIDHDQIQQSLLDLAAGHLILSRSPERYELHDLIRIFANGQARDEISPSARRAALSRLFDYYLYGAALAMQRYGARRSMPAIATVTPVILDEAGAGAWLGAERSNLMATAIYAADHRWPSYAVELSARLGRYLSSTGHAREGEILHSYASRVARGSERASPLIWLVSAKAALGKLRAARDLGSQILREARENSDRDFERGACLVLGSVTWQLGAYADALEFQKRAYALADGENRLRQEASALNNLGVVYQHIGQYSTAEDCHAQARKIAQELGSRAAEGLALHNFGRLLERRGDHAGARARHEVALSIARELGLRTLECEALNRLGSTFTLLGEPERGEGYQREALAIARETGHLEGELDTLNELGLSTRQQGRPVESREWHEEARATANEIGDRYQEARAYDGLAGVSADLGDVATCRSHLQRAHTVFTELGTPEAAETRDKLAELVTTSP